VTLPERELEFRTEIGAELPVPLGRLREVVRGSIHQFLQIALGYPHRVVIEWTPKLRDVERRLKALRTERRAFGSFVFTKQSSKKKGKMQAAGQRYTYSGAHSAWVRACERAGVADCRFNDMRAKALTDTEELDGMQAARRKGAHSTEQQTSDYIRHKRPQKSKATK